MSPARRCSLMSGWRRMMPVAEQGASSRMRSNGRPSHQVAGCVASPANTVACNPEPFEVFADARETRRVEIERDEIELGAFEHVRGLAAGRGAGIEHALPVGEIEQIDDALRGAVLHREKTFCIAGKTRHIRAALEHDRVLEIVVRGRSDVVGAKTFEKRRPAAATPVDAQRQRRFAVVRGEDRVGVVGPVASQRVDEPARMRRARDFVGVEARIERHALAHEATQQRVDETAVARLAEFARGVDARGDDGVIGHFQNRDLSETDGEQCAHVARLWRQWFFQDLCDRGVQTQPPARRLEQCRREQRAIARIRETRRGFGERRAQRRAVEHDARQRARSFGAQRGAGVHRVAPGSRRALCQSRTLIRRPPARCTSRIRSTPFAGGDIERIASAADDRARAPRSRCRRSRARTRCAGARRRFRLPRRATDRTREPCARARSRIRSSRVALRSCRSCARRRRHPPVVFGESASRRVRCVRVLPRAHRRRARRDDRAANRRFRHRRSACVVRSGSDPYRGRPPSASDRRRFRCRRRGSRAGSAPRRASAAATRRARSSSRGAAVRARVAEESIRTRRRRSDRARSRRAVAARRDLSASPAVRLRCLARARAA